MTTARIMAAALASIAAFLLGNSYAACLLSLPGSPASNLTEAAKRLPSFLLGHGPLSLEAAALATGLVAACAVWCAWAWSLTHGNPERQGEEHGSARWGTVREGRRFMNLEDPDRNIVLTKHFGMAMDRPDHDRRFERNRNVLVVGGSGSGKTRGFFEPNIMQLNSNYLVTDPKGETLPRMGHMLEAAGYRILAFNTVDFSKSLHYNPLAYIRDEADILEFVSCLIENTTGDREHAGDPFWENAERLLYVALIGYLVGLATLGWTVSRGPMEGGSMADPKHPRHFTDDFKRQIASLYNAGKPPSEIVREYDLGSTTLRRWIDSINATGSPHAADDRTPEQSRIIELERESKRLRMEAGVLKQAALIFARK